MHVRAVAVSTLSVFTWLGSSLPGRAQDLSALNTPTLRVDASAASNGSSSPQSVQAPVLGFVASTPSSLHRGRAASGRSYLWSGAEVRAILGVPGATLLGSPLPLPRGVVSVHFAPGESYALAEQSGSTMALLPFNGAQAGSLLALPGAISSADVVAFSPNASSAAVFSAAAGRLVVIAGLPDSPRLASDTSAASLPANIQMLALADDGATLLAGTGDGRALLLRASSAPQMVYQAGSLGGIGFVPASADALLIDGDGNAVSIQNMTTAPATRLLAQGLPGLSGTVVLQFDAGSAIVGAVNAKTLSRIDLQTLHVDQLPLPSGLAMLQPLRTPHRFLLSAESGHPAWILDTSATTAAVYFVPQPAMAKMAR